MTFLIYLFSGSKGELDVIADPYTDVYLDNFFMGQTTAEGAFKLGGIKTGTHTIKLANSCYGEYEQTKQFDSASWCRYSTSQHTMYTLRTSSLTKRTS